MAEELVATLITALKNINTATTVIIDRYDDKKETITNYFTRLENYFTSQNIVDVPATGTTPAKPARAQFLINHLSAEYHNTLRDLCSPASTCDKSYNELKRLLIKHYDVTTNEIVEQHRFIQRTQNEGESINKYAAELRNIAAGCNFTCLSCKKSTADVHLRAQFIRGVRDTELRRFLLQQAPDKLNFTNAVDQAGMFETSKLGSDQMGNSTTKPTVVKVNRLATHRGKGKNRGGSRRGYSRGYFNLSGCCFRCGETSHRADTCTHIDSTCTSCNKKGHLQKVCQKSNRSSGNNNNFRGGYRGGRGNRRRPYYKRNVENQNALQIDGSNADPANINYFDMSVLRCDAVNNKLYATVQINNKYVDMEFDTGAAVSAMPITMFRKTTGNTTIQETTVQFRAYNNEIIKPLGVATVRVKYNDLSRDVNLYVVPDNFSTVLGREWIFAFDMLPKINLISTDTNREVGCEVLVQEYSSLFEEGIGKVPGYEVFLKLRPDAVPIFHKPYSLPFAIKPLVEAELNYLESVGVISKATGFPKWGTPIVPVINEKGKVRICGNYKATINQYMITKQYPIPKLIGIMSKLAGGCVFIALDICKAYLHLPVDQETAEIQCISTHLGPYYVHRMMPGVKNGPMEWQQFIEMVIRSINGVSAFYDDIRIQGRTIQELLARLRAVFERLSENNLHLNKKKCQFNCTSITYLGFKIDKDGIHKTEEKIDTIVRSKPPTNVTELKSFIGLVNYYNMFLQNLSTLMAPLNQLLRKNVRFEWNEDCQRAFEELKRQMSEERITTPYNPDLPLILATDASPYGIGGCLSHIVDNVEKPVAFCSRTLTDTEKNYSQLDREATAIYWCIKRFFMYLYGRQFTLLTDHQPLTAILNPTKKLPSIVASRLLRYAQFMNNFSYTIKYREAAKHANADFPSRFPLPNTDYIEKDITILQIEQIQVLPVTADKISEESKNDPELRKVICALQGNSGLKGTIFEDRDAEFSMENGCIFRGIRVVIPDSLKFDILKELHYGHLGISRMKTLAREYVYWKSIDRDIESYVKSCKGCKQVQNNPAKENIHPWLYPEVAWNRLHVDFAGPFQESYFLLVVDAYSKWVEVIPMTSITTKQTIELLENLFVQFGLPVTLVSDNGPQWTSTEFENFVSRNGITHKRSAPYNPSTNGQVERYVQALKRSLKAMAVESGKFTKDQLQKNLNEFLVQQRRSVHSFTGASPAELLLRHRYRTKIDLVKSDRVVKLREEQLAKIHEGQKRKFNEDVQIRVYNQPSQKWESGKIVEKEGPCNFKVQGADGAIHRRHANQMISSGTTSTSMESTAMGKEPTPVPSTSSSEDVTTTTSSSPQLRRSSRNKKAPNRLTY